MLLVVWSGFVSAILSLANLKELEVVFPATAPADRHVQYALLTDYLPVVIQLALFNLLPVLFEQAARAYEGQKSSFEVQRSVLDRYFYFQLVNIFVTIFSGSLLDELCKLAKKPDKIFRLLSETLPQVAAYLMQLIVVKTLFGLAWELARPTAIARTWARKLVPYRYRTRRRLKAAAEPPELLYGHVLPGFLLVLVICQIYAVIAPPVMPFGFLFFVGAELVYKRNLLFCYVPKFESGGLLWPSLFEHTITGLVASHATLIGLLALKQGVNQVAVMLPLPVATLVFRRYCAAAYTAPSRCLSREDARRIEGAWPRAPARADERDDAADLAAYRQPALLAGRLAPNPLRDRRAAAAAAGSVNGPSDAYTLLVDDDDDCADAGPGAGAYGSTADDSAATR